MCVIGISPELETYVSYLLTVMQFIKKNVDYQEEISPG
jgi:hypothetical protein